MVRTGDRCVRVAGGKSSEKKGGSSTSVSSGGPGPSTSRSNPSIGGNPVCPREIPSWQKPITCFFTKEEGRSQKFTKTEVGESSKITVTPHLENFPAVAGPSVEADEPMTTINTLNDNLLRKVTKDEVEKEDKEDSHLHSEEKEMIDEEKEVRNAIDALNDEVGEENKSANRVDDSSHPVTPRKNNKQSEADTKYDQKDNSLLGTPKSERKQSSSDDCSVPSQPGSDNVAASRKRLGDDSDATMDENKSPVKKLKLDVSAQEIIIDEGASCSMVEAYFDFPSILCINDYESDSSGFDEIATRKRENPVALEDATNDRPAKKFKFENDQPRYQTNGPACVFEDIKSSSDDWSAVNDSGSEDSVANRKAIRRVNPKRSPDGSVSPSKISDLDSTLLAIHIGESSSVSINEDIIVISSDEVNSDMDLDDSTVFSPVNPYQYMNGDCGGGTNNSVYDAPPPQDDVPQGQNNPMDFGYPGNNNDVPDNVYHPVENGYPEDDGSLAGNNSDDDPPEDSDEEDDADESDAEEDIDDEDDDEEDDGEVSFYANLHFYNNHNEE